MILSWTRRKSKSHYSAELYPQNALSCPLFHLLGFFSHPGERKDDGKADGEMIVTGFGFLSSIGAKPSSKMARLFLRLTWLLPRTVTVNASLGVRLLKLDELTHSERPRSSVSIEIRISLDDGAIMMVRDRFSQISATHVNAIPSFGEHGPANTRAYGADQRTYTIQTSNEDKWSAFAMILRRSTKHLFWYDRNRSSFSPLYFSYSSNRLLLFTQEMVVINIL